MYKDHISLMEELNTYSSPRARITRMIKTREVIKVRRGIFLDIHDKDYSLKSLASIIYGPSYISFEYALASHGLIPERARAITSAIYRKNKNRFFHTPLGDFYYFYMPAEVYPYGIMRKEENRQGYLIATPEKALMDTLYKARGITTEKDLLQFLLQDLRMDQDRILAMDRESVLSLAPLYRRKALSLFMKWLARVALYA